MIGDKATRPVQAQLRLGSRTTVALRSAGRLLVRALLVLTLRGARSAWIACNASRPTTRLVAQVWRAKQPTVPVRFPVTRVFQTPAAWPSRSHSANESVLHLSKALLELRVGQTHIAVIPTCERAPGCAQCVALDDCAWCASAASCVPIASVFEQECRGTVFDEPCPTTFSPSKCGATPNIACASPTVSDCARPIAVTCCSTRPPAVASQSIASLAT